MPERRTRREALAAALALPTAGAAALALPAAAGAAERSAEGDALTALVRAEQAAAFAYREADLPGGLGERLAGHDDEHARALATHVEALTLGVPRPPRTREDLPPAALAVLEAASSAARLRAALAFERALIEGCERTLPVLEHANTVRTVATVMAGHAQHETELARVR